MYVILDSPGFTYDVHSLVKAFYPDEDVNVTGEAVADAGEYMEVHVSPNSISDDTLYSGCITVSAGSSENGCVEKADFEELARSDIKNLLKRTLYRTLSKVTGKKLPWGTMTGIRPTKVVMKMVRQQEADERIRDYMSSVYLCSDEKIRLATDIARREIAVLDSLPPGGFGLYIGIPFCPTTCLYCSFTSYPIVSWRTRTGDYLDAVKRELDMFAGYYNGRPVNSLYIGGGTPTTLTPQELSDLCGYVRAKFNLSDLREFTVEAGRPDSIDAEKLGVLKEEGVNRISINPQTMNDRTLGIIGRHHSSRDVYRAFELARAAGFTNINTDLILGLPGEDEKDVKYTFDRIRELAPESLTVHSMAIKRAAGMHDYLVAHPGAVSRNTLQMMEIASDAAADMGLDAYYLYRQKNMSGNLENVGFARSDCYGVYNIVMMEEVCDIAAAGAGTISKRVFDNGLIDRCDNVKDVALYIDRIDEMIDRKKKLFS